MSALSSRLKALTRLRCEIFQTSYNPQNLRTGAKYLRKHLRGPSMVKYYPEVLNLSAIAREFPKMGIVDPKEAQRLADVEDRKRRGKGTPKKAKTKADSRRTAKKR
ncbi:mitochondrial 37S ribosomal protein S27 [Favolaschia claudopus]|uniref:Small ribosomal subunit protein mS33 n=1 Tax=Favolaschia claudopus TaxID=2862362 RepID=A0AAW0BXX3_9AGAR